MLIEESDVLHVLADYLCLHYMIAYKMIATYDIFAARHESDSPQTPPRIKT